MKRILNFEQYLFEASMWNYSYPEKVELIPEQIQDITSKVVTKRLFHHFIEDKNLIRIYTKEVEDGSLRLIINWKENVIEVPGIKWNYRGMFIDEKVAPGEIIAFGNDLLEKGLILPKKYGDVALYGKWNNDEVAKGSDVLSSLVDDLVGTSRKEGGFLNPFDTDFQNGSTWKAIEKMGTSIVSSPLQRRKGILVIRNDKADTVISIHPNGYVRRVGTSRIQVLTKNLAITKPIYSEEILNLKLEYVRFYLMKKIMAEGGIPDKEIREFMKILEDKPLEYDQRAKEFVEKWPRAALVLPQPEGGFDPDIVQGARLLNRFGGFNF